MTKIEDKKYNPLEEYLNDITKNEITLDEQEQKRYNRYLDKVLRHDLLNKMREKDELFNLLYNQFKYAGSYFENLKVGKPNEFDINLQIHLPATVKVADDEPGFVTLKIEELHDKKKKSFQDVPKWQDMLRKKWLDDDSYLLTNKVRFWMQGVVNKAIGAMGELDYEIAYKQSGPATTVVVTQRVPQEEGGCEEVFSVDLVPVFVFGKEQWPTNMRGTDHNKEWCAVPKGSHKAEKHGDRYWRPSFYEQEKTKMNDKHAMKKAVKLIKLLRDKMELVSLASYYIKTVFIWEIHHREDEENFWQKQSCSCVFIHILKRLRNHLENGKIAFFWDERVNLIDKWNSDEVRNVRNRIGKMLETIDKNIEKNPQIVLQYFRRLPQQGVVANAGKNVPEEEDPSEVQVQPPLAEETRLSSVAAGIGTGVAVVVGAVALAAGLSWLLRDPDPPRRSGTRDTN